jgi:hypothetical protein
MATPTVAIASVARPENFRRIDPMTNSLQVTGDDTTGWLCGVVDREHCTSTGSGVGTAWM